MGIREDVERWRIAADNLALAQQHGDAAAIAAAQALETAMLETVIRNLQTADAHNEVARGKLRNEIWEMLADHEREFWAHVDRLGLNQALGAPTPGEPDAPGD